MTSMTRFAGIAALVLIAAACGQDSESASDRTSSPFAPTSTTPATTSADASGSVAESAGPTSPTTAAPRTTRSDFETTADIQRAIAPLGLECSDEDSALFCNRGTDSWQFRISPQGDGDAAFRKSSCDAGMSDGSTGVITDGGKFVVYAGNDGQNLEGFETELAAAGITNLSIERGC